MIKYCQIFTWSSNFEDVFDVLLFGKIIITMKNENADLHIINKPVTVYTRDLINSTHSYDDLI